MGVQPALPVPGVTFILGNDIAGGKVLPVLEVLDIPEISSMSDRLAKEFPGVFPACVVTRAQSRRFGDMIDLEGTVIQPVFANDEFPDQGQGGVPPEHLREVKPTAPKIGRASCRERV